MRRARPPHPRHPAHDGAGSRMCRAPLFSRACRAPLPSCVCRARIFSLDMCARESPRLCVALESPRLFVARESSRLCVARESLRLCVARASPHPSRACVSCSKTGSPRHPNATHTRAGVVAQGVGDVAGAPVSSPTMPPGHATVEARTGRRARASRSFRARSGACEGRESAAAARPKGSAAARTERPSHAPDLVRQIPAKCPPGTPQPPNSRGVRNANQRRTKLRATPAPPYRSPARML